MTRCFPHVVCYEVIEFRYLESMNGLVVANLDRLRKVPCSFNIIIIEQTVQTGSVCETGVSLGSGIDWPPNKLTPAKLQL